MAKGRHADRASGSFYRDLAMMTLGILLVGAAVFILLYLVVGDGSVPTTSPSSAATSSTTVTSIDVTTTTVRGSTTSTTVITTTSEGVPVRPPSEVRVVVLNSIGVAGAAGAFTSVLADAGYNTVQPGDYRPEQNPSRIWYREGFSTEANALLEFLPRALVEPIPDPELEPGADVVVVLGTGYTG